MDTEVNESGELDAEWAPQPSEMVLPLVIRIERAAPPHRTDALEAAARAVLFMLTTDRPDWQPAVSSWDAHRIRKVVRRARGAEWNRAADLDGMTIAHGSAEIRVYPPIPLEGWPRDLARLQVSGTDLVDDYSPGEADPGHPVILLSPYVTMSTGKAMAQAGHAAQLGYRELGETARTAWHSDGFTLAVRDATPTGWASALRAGAPVVRDAGFTEVSPNSETATVLLP
jgi:hypothetical protein